MEFDFGNLSDYLKETNNNGQVTVSGNRKVIRDMVERRQQMMSDVLNAGGNIHTWSLDFSDEFSNFISPLDDERKVVILEMYTEELNASAAAMNAEADRIIAETENIEKKGAAVGQWIGAGVLFLFLLLMFGVFS